ncbi:hypothetical protein D3C79_681430 [compost metagenome]
MATATWVGAGVGLAGATGLAGWVATGLGAGATGFGATATGCTGALTVGCAAVGAGPAGTPCGGAMVVTVGGLDGCNAVESAGPPSSPSPMPAAWARGSRMTGCDWPTSGSGIGWDEPENSMAGLPLFDWAAPGWPSTWAWAGASAGALSPFLGMRTAAATATTTTADSASTCFLGILNPMDGRLAVERLAIMASIKVSRATWLMLPGQPSAFSWISTICSRVNTSMPRPAPSRRCSRYSRVSSSL